jgi:hypothetical protein
MIPSGSANPSPLISSAEVRRRLAAGEKPTVLDARGRAAFARSEERVEGDLRASGRDLSPLIATLDAGPGRGAWLVAYCTCLGDGLAVRVAETLRAAGFAQAFGIEDGLAGCVAAGLTIVPKPPGPAC